MKASSASAPSLPTTNALPGLFRSMQLSFSTAEVERGIFYGPAPQAAEPGRQTMPPTTLLVVHGDVYRLEQSAPPGAVPFTEDAGLFRLVDADK